ncbi:MAG: hypothetical protein QNJ98_13645 [Planctomycetota bacterium]|nr:hypothetical protein [Planctomycetota bacterium]
MDEQQQAQEPKGSQKEPTNGAESPRDPKDRAEGTRKPEAEAEASEAKDDGAAAWVASLPPQIRDAVQNGDFTKIPARYRKLVEDYLKRLAKDGSKR